jgi:hypothetical protein
MGRLHAILTALLAYFRALDPSDAAQGGIELHVDGTGDAWIVFPQGLPNLAA